MRSKAPSSGVFVYCIAAVAWQRSGIVDVVAASKETSPEPYTSQILLKRALEGEHYHDQPSAETEATNSEEKLDTLEETSSFDASNNWLLRVPLSPWHDTKTGLIGGPSTVDSAATHSEKPVILTDKQRAAAAAALYAKAVMPTLSRFSPDEAGQAEQEELRRLLDPASPFMQHLAQLQTPTMLQFDEDLSDLPMPQKDSALSLENMEKALMDMGVSQETAQSLLFVLNAIVRMFSQFQDKYQELLGDLFQTDNFLGARHDAHEEKPTEKGSEDKEEEDPGAYVKQL